MDAFNDIGPHNAVFFHIKRKKNPYNRLKNAEFLGWVSFEPSVTTEDATGEEFTEKIEGVILVKPLIIIEGVVKTNVIRSYLLDTFLKNYECKEVPYQGDREEDYAEYFV